MFIRKYLLFRMVAFLIYAAPNQLFAEESGMKVLNKSSPVQLSEVILAGGCFWCMEPPFEKLEGVSDVISGYAGGKVENPSYEQVSTDTTGHREVVMIKYDAAKVSFEKLLEVFWMNVNPTDDGGQFADRGFQYTTAVFVSTPEQKKTAEDSKLALEKSGRFKKPIVTPILDSVKFYPAEEYHQDYYKKNPIRYKFYRSGSGRDKFIEQHWPNAAVK